MRISKGVSLLELLIGITVAAVAGGLLISMMISTNNIFFKQTVQVNQGLSLNQTALEISEAIKSSAGISSQYPATGSPQYTTGVNTLIIKIPSVNQSGQVIDAVYDYVIFSKDSQNPALLKKRIFVDSLSSRKTENKVLSTSLGKIVFNFFDSSSNPITPTQATRVGFIINLSTPSDLAQNESSASGIVNIKNL